MLLRVPFKFNSVICPQSFELAVDCMMGDVFASQAYGGINLGGVLTGYFALNVLEKQQVVTSRL